jgi:hypothetical protein
MGLCAALAGCKEPPPTPATQAAASQPSAKPETAPTTKADTGISLFDGKTLGKWVDCNFAGGGEIVVEDGNLILRVGERLTGIRWTGEPPPKANYEVSLKAKRVDGSDFFCGLTFPVADAHASLIVGGWGGALVGISSIDGDDAAHNEFKTYGSFEDNTWYAIRVRVTADKILAFIDDKKVIEVPTAGKKFSLRGDIEEATPLGIASFQTTAALRDIRLTKLASDEKAPAR